MTVEQFRAAHRAQPFRPFTLHMADGRSVQVGHPEYASISPTGRMVIVNTDDGGHSVIDLLLVNELQVHAPNVTSAAGQSNGQT